MHISLSVLHMVFYVVWIGSQSCKFLVVDPVAQILRGLRVEKETTSRRLLLWSQKVTFDNRWNSQTQFRGPQQGFCQIKGTCDLLPWWGCSGAPRNHPSHLPACLESASRKTLPMFCWIFWTNTVLQSIAFRINGSGWLLFSCCFSS